MWKYSQRKSVVLIIHSATGHFKEKISEKYLILNSIDKYENVWSEIRSEIKTLNGGKEIMQESELILTMIYLWTNN